MKNDKNTKEQLLNDIDKLNVKITELKKYKTEYIQAIKIKTIIYEISKATNSTNNLDELYKFIHEILKNVLDVTNFYIAHYDEKEQMLSFPYFKDEIDKAPESAVPFGNGITEYVIKTGKPLLINDIEVKECERRGKFQSSGIESELWMGAPLIMDNKVIGVIALNSYHDPKLYTKSDLKILTYVAEQIALAITQKRAIIDMQIEKTYLEELFTSSSEALALVTTDSTILHINKQFTTLFGYNEKEVIGRNIDELIVPADDLENALKITRKVSLGKHQYFDTIRKKKDGKIIAVSVLGSPVNYKGNVLAVYAAYRDISERKKAEKEMQKLVAVVKHSSELINLSTLEGKMIFLNESGGKMLGIEPHEIENVSIMEVIPDHLKELVEKELRPALMRGEIWEGDLQYRNMRTNELTDVHAMTFTIKDTDTGEPQYLANVSLDITKRKRAEKN